MPQPTTPPTPPLPKLADVPAFAPVERRMLELNREYADARAATSRELDAMQARGGPEARGYGNTREYDRATATEGQAKQAREAFYRDTYWPAERAARAALLPRGVADLWRPVVEATAAACRTAAAQVAAAAALRDELAAGGLPVPHADAVPAGLFGDPADDTSPLGRLLAAAAALAVAGM